jgi:hypothetical protein
MSNRRLGEFRIKPFLLTVVLLFAAALFIFTRFSFQRATPEDTGQNRDIQKLSERVAVLESEIRTLRADVNQFSGRLEEISKAKPTAQATPTQNQKSTPSKAKP